ncbi:MAG TPA: hypothetical protein VIH11_07130 [Gemmatimonadaceae bacterium]
MGTKSGKSQPMLGSELVKLARELERAMARRRVSIKRLAALDDAIRTKRKLLRDLAVGVVADVYVNPAGKEF